VLLAMLFLAIFSTGNTVLCQELAYEFEVDGIGVVEFTFVVNDEWVLSKPLIVGYTLSVEGNSENSGSVISVLKMVFKCGDVVDSNEYLLGSIKAGGKLSGFIVVKPVTSLLYCEEDYVVLEPHLLLCKAGNKFSQYSYQLAPLIVKLTRSAEATYTSTSSCRVSIENSTATALEFCIETVQPWTPASVARVLVLLRSTKALEDVAVGIRAGKWILASRILDLAATSAHARFSIDQRALAALWRENRSLTLTGYARVGKLYVEVPLEIVFEKPSVRLLVDLKPQKLVAGVPSTIAIRITNVWTKAVVVKGVELVFNETKLWFNVGKKLAIFDSLTVKRRIVVNRTGATTLGVKIYYDVGMGISGCIEKEISVEVASPLKILSLEPSVVEVNKTIRITALSLIGSHNATLLAYPVNGGEPIVLAKDLHLNSTPTTLELIARLEPGEYLVKIVDEHGYKSNSLRLRVVKSKYSVEEEPKIMVVPLQTSAMIGEVVEVRVAVSPPRNTTFKLYRFVGRSKSPWTLERILEVVEVAPGVYTVKYRAPSKPGIYMYKLVVTVDGVEKETEFTLKVEEKEGRLGLPQKTISPHLLPDWILLTLVAMSTVFGLILFKKYSRGA